MPNRDPKNDTERRVNAMLIAVDVANDTSHAMLVLRTGMISVDGWKDLLPLVQVFLRAELSVLEESLRLIEKCMEIDADNEARMFYPDLIAAMKKRLQGVKESLNLTSGVQ